MIVLALFDEGMEEAKKDIQQEASGKKKKEACSCGRVICCGKHKNCQCSCKKEGKERD